MRTTPTVGSKGTAEPGVTALTKAHCRRRTQSDDASVTYLTANAGNADLPASASTSSNARQKETPNRKAGGFGVKPLAMTYSCMA